MGNPIQSMYSCRHSIYNAMVAKIILTLVRLFQLPICELMMQPGAK